MFSLLCSFWASKEISPQVFRREDLRAQHPESGCGFLLVLVGSLRVYSYIIAQQAGSGHKLEDLQKCSEALHLAVQVLETDLQMESVWLYCRMKIVARVLFILACGKSHEIMIYHDASKPFAKLPAAVTSYRCSTYFQKYTTNRPPPGFLLLILLPSLLIHFFLQHT